MSNHRHNNPPTQPHGDRGEEKSTNRHVFVESDVQINLADNLKEQLEIDRKQNTAHQKTQIRWTTVAAGLLFLTVLIYFLQWRSQVQALKVEQRAWVGVPFPLDFPSNGGFIPVVTQIKNTGKTPARHVEVDAIATILDKGQEPDLGNYEAGHPHDHLYFPVIFPDTSFPLKLAVVRYGPKSSEPIVPDDQLRKDIEDGKRLLIFHGRVTYDDVLGVSHWTQFCTGTGPGMLGILKECVRFNDVGENEK